MQEMKRTTDGFNFVFQEELSANGEVIVKIPDVSPNKKSISDIGWQTDGDVTLYGTLSAEPEDNSAIWQEIEEGEEINKAVYALKAVCGAESANIVIRVIFN